MSGRCIMMCAGEYHPMEINIRQDDFMVAVDGGLVHLLEAGIEPDLLLGDFDSLEEAAFTGNNDSDGKILSETIARYRAMGPDHFLQLPVAKDDTDTMAAVKLGLEKGYREFLIYGAMGGRPDHVDA